MDKLSNERASYDKAVAYREAAIADGWDCEASYEIESVKRAARLTRDGWVIQILSRDNRDRTRKFNYDASVAVWAPDRLAVRARHPYSFEQLEAATRECLYCDAKDVDTVLISFAGRCCAECRPRLAKTHERPGWTN